MSDPFIGEIRPFALSFSPAGWLPCDGSRIPIATYMDLFAVIGESYGAADSTTFVLPNISGRVPVGMGSVVPAGCPETITKPGVTFGEEGTALELTETPYHTHTISVATNKKTAWVGTPTTSSVPATPYYNSGNTLYLAWSPLAEGESLVSMATGALGTGGSGSEHENRQPFLAFRYCIAAWGIYPNYD